VAKRFVQCEEDYCNCKRSLWLCICTQVFLAAVLLSISLVALCVSGGYKHHSHTSKFNCQKVL